MNIFPSMLIFIYSDVLFTTNDLHYMVLRFTGNYMFIYFHFIFFIIMTKALISKLMWNKRCDTKSIGGESGQQFVLRFRTTTRFWWELNEKYYGISSL